MSMYLASIIGEVCETHYLAINFFQVTARAETRYTHGGRRIQDVEQDRQRSDRSLQVQYSKSAIYMTSSIAVECRSQ